VNEPVPCALASEIKEVNAVRSTRYERDSILAIMGSPLENDAQRRVPMSELKCSVKE
jgi:hypothetical protein